MNKDSSEKKLRKVVYFDDLSASEYIDLVNEGHLEWTEDKNKERIANMILEIDAEVGTGFNFMSWMKANLSGKTNVMYDKTVKTALLSKINNTILTDFISLSSEDRGINKFEGVLYARENSISLYKMYSPYTIIMPKDTIPLDLERLNEALESAKGYYEMILQQGEKDLVLRFNSKAFRNNYNISDLTKMELSYYAIKVGSCESDKLDMSMEFDFNKKSPTANDVLGLKNEEQVNCLLDVYDVILAGVEI